MTLQPYVVGFDYDECPALEYDCHGDCCDQEIPHRADGEEQRCPGWHNPDTWCQESPDYCMPSTYDNSYRYAPSLGAAKECYLECPPQCGDNDWSCNFKRQVEEKIIKEKHPIHQTVFLSLFIDFP